ncbi:DUF3854 domain-containing protein [Butyrivibrio sp. AC2005]|uniref:DUF3854 domain-containing protein n=1 Tax=Butyrivibrio sp. AC2005 TaxID=1280672 RepID=UPI0003FF5C2F|nr:DUF3854 domain-containing protein [Butyrivibrio sp. AC2005]
MYKGYSWSCSDVLSLLSVRYNPDKEEQMIPCPFCGSKRFGMNIKKGTGHCFKCCATADSASYYAAATGLSLNDARDDIKRRLNIPDKYGKLPERKVFKEKKQENLAPIEVRDKTYRAFLDELILSQKNYDHLKSRGFSDDDIVAKGYKTYPSVENTSFEDLCRRLIARGCTLSGIPGFYKNYQDEWTFIRLTPGIIIPQIGIHNQIEGFQIRKDDDLRRVFDEKLESKIAWFSTKGYCHGACSHTTVHIATDFIYNKEKGHYEPVLHGDIVTLTEGGMKADLCACLLDNHASLIAVQGVHSLNPLKDALLSLKQYGLKTVNIAFDMDYLSNPNVQDAMEKVTVLIGELGLKCENLMNWEYKQRDEKGDEFFLKGLDDYLAFQQRGIKPVIVKE